MKAISLWQPWASLMANGTKRIETRGWPTKYRGQLAIHAAKHIEEPEPADFFMNALENEPDDLPQGAILAVVELYECRSVEWIQGLEDFTKQEMAFGDYSAGRGRYGFMTRCRQRLPQPIPCRGMQLIWDLPTHIEAMVRTALKNL